MYFLKFMRYPTFVNVDKVFILRNDMFSYYIHGKYIFLIFTIVVFTENNIFLFKALFYENTNFLLAFIIILFKLSYFARHTLDLFKNE